MELLEAYEWKGNVRELKNVIERTCILSPARVVTSDDLSFLRTAKRAEQIVPVITSTTLPLVADLPEIDPSNLTLREMERRHIIHVLGLVNGHKGKAAKILDINAKTLYLKMKMYNIIAAYE
jgi:DNA-binding NtrC family response regulator